MWVGGWVNGWTLLTLDAVLHSVTIDRNELIFVDPVLVGLGGPLVGEGGEFVCWVGGWVN